MSFVRYTCANCGVVYEARTQAYKSTCSAACSSARLFESVRAMTEKRGPMYLAWKAQTEAARQHAQQGKRKGVMP